MTPDEQGWRQLAGALGHGEVRGRTTQVCSTRRLHHAERRRTVHRPQHAQACAVAAHLAVCAIELPLRQWRTVVMVTCGGSSE